MKEMKVEMKDMEERSTKEMKDMEERITKEMKVMI